MKASNRSVAKGIPRSASGVTRGATRDNPLRLLTLAALMAVMMAGSLASAAPAPKTVSKARQSDGTPHKASSFAPRPTSKRVFGTPIQPPILKQAPPKQSTPK
jgi:hypothetical protein